MPFGREYSSMVQSPDGRGVLTAGGVVRRAGKWAFDDRLYELRAGANSWNILNITLENARANHVFIPLQ